MEAVGIYPPKGKEELGLQQAAYATLMKRHWDAICIATVGIGWPDESFWMFHIYDSDAGMRECFWLDHRGTLKHDQDLKEEFVADPIHALGHKQRKEYPAYLWASSVIPEAGIPQGDDLTEGMRVNEVDQYRVPMGVKFLLPAFKRATYADNFDEMTVDDFVHNPGKLHWFYRSSEQRVRRGNPVLPIVHPNQPLTKHDPDLVWEDEFDQDIPVDCLTDWYRDDGDTLIPPSHGDRCWYERHDHTKDPCQYNGKRDEDQAAYGPDGYALPSLQERHVGKLVIDKNARGNGDSAKELCEDANSVGPDYVNHVERQYCRMRDKTLWPFCDSAAEISHNCWDEEADVLVEEDRPLQKREAYWDVIEEWEDGESVQRPA
ncbi:hypothetical protein Daus18300_009896 [Diaporthe australafricana]|uniref:Uncharacterized protein n=1 Tax=Diaporthe australafricana TaxID=127596 RepID=A0ABR3WCB8_9PEZI